jgi:flavin-dependent dehydrogenase
VWEVFRDDGHLPCSGFVSCWGHPEPAFRSTVFDAHGPSWQIERRRFNRMLLTAAVAAGATGPLPWRLTAVQHHRQRRVLSLTQDDRVRRLTTDFVIDATGRRSSVARLLGVRRRVDSSLVCIAGLLDDPDSEDAAAVVESVEHGWWYGSRVPGGRLVSAVFTDAETADSLRLTTLDGWLQLLSRTTLMKARAGWPRIRLAGSLRAAAAGSSSLTRYGGRDWVAVGDAACAHDPLSSRGLYDALDTGIAAANATALALEGDVDATDRYAARVGDAYDSYLRELAWFYAAEGRFPASPFWCRRALTVRAEAG